MPTRTGNNLFLELKAARTEADWNEIYLQLRELPSFDSEYCISAIRDILVGDHVLFFKACYKEKLKREIIQFNKRISNYDIVRTEILSETFTNNIWRLHYDYEDCMVKGFKKKSVLWINAKLLWISGVWRKPWDNEEERKEIRRMKYGKEERAKVF